MKEPKYILGSGSLRVYQSGIHVDQRRIIDEMLHSAPIDFTLVSGLRTAAQQWKLYQVGRQSLIPNSTSPTDWTETGGGVVTYCDGIKKKSRHQSGFAIDIQAYIPGRPDLSYDKIHLAVLVGAFQTMANSLYANDNISHVLRSGADWDRDTQYLEPGTFIDMPHLELIKP